MKGNENIRPRKKTGHREDVRGKKLLYAALLNSVITAIEIAGGILSNSLSLLSDALHNFGDALAVFIAYIANRISKKGPTSRQTFGYKRIEILAALLNAVVLIVICVYLFYEAYKRFYQPSHIKGPLMLAVAGAGLIVNLIAVLILHGDSRENLNIRSAYLHLLGDTLSSFVVIGGGLLITFLNIYWVDPLITVLIGLYILWEAFRVLKESYRILMQATPRGLYPSEIKKAIETLPYISNLHHIHTWQLNDRQIHFEAHADLSDDIRISQADGLRIRIESLLKEKFGIVHSTIQFEHGHCNDKNK